MKLIKVQWRDALGGDGWLQRKDLEKEVPVIHNSVGYVVKDTKEFVTISMSYDETGDNMGAWLTIPRLYIIKITKL